MKKIISLAVLCAFSFANGVSAAGLAPEDFNKMYALAHNGEVYALRGSVQRGLNIDSLDKYGNTGLCVSIYRNDQRAYNTFRAAGANPRHPCTQNIPAARYESFMSSSRVVAVNETPRQAFNVIRSGFMYSAKFWETALVGVAGIAAIAMSGGGGGGGSSAVEETPLLAGDKSVAIISGTKKLEPLVDEETGEKTEQNLIGKIYYNDVESLDTLPEISSVTSAIDALERGYTITKMPLALAQNFGVYFKVTNGASVNSHTVPEVSAGQIGMVVQGYKTEYRDETIIETDDEGNEVEKTIKVPYTKVSSLKNHSKIDVIARNGAIGMVAGNYAEATNLNEIELKLSDGGTFKNGAIVGMYGDTGSSIFNESNINGHMESAAGSGEGSIIGMMLSFVSKITDKLPTYGDDEDEKYYMSATNSGTINLESNNANTIGLVGMGSYLATNLSPNSNIGNAILNNTGIITISYKTTDSSSETQSNPISLINGQGLVGGMGMRADAKTTAKNSNRITVIGGQNSAAGMLAVNGGVIQNDKEIIIGDGKVITVAFGMAALNGTRSSYISEIINNGTITLEKSTSGSKAIYIEGQTKVTLGEHSNITLNSSGQSVIYNGNQDGTALGSKDAPITLNGTITLDGSANVTTGETLYVLEGNFGTVSNQGTITFSNKANGSLLYQNGKMGTFTNYGTINWNSQLAEDYESVYLLDANEFVNNGTFNVNRQLYYDDGDETGQGRELIWLIQGKNVNKEYKSTGDITINDSIYTGGIAIINDAELKDSSTLEYGRKDAKLTVPGNGIYTENVGKVSFIGTLNIDGSSTVVQTIADSSISKDIGDGRKRPDGFGIFALRANNFIFDGTMYINNNARYGIFNTDAINSNIKGNIYLYSNDKDTKDAIGIYISGQKSSSTTNTATLGETGNTLAIINSYSLNNGKKWTYSNVGIAINNIGTAINNYNLDMTITGMSESVIGINLSNVNNYTGNGNVVIKADGSEVHVSGYEIAQAGSVTINGDIKVTSSASTGTAQGIFSNGDADSITHQNGFIYATSKGIVIDEGTKRTNLYSKGNYIQLLNPDASLNHSGIFANYMGELINTATIINNAGTLSYGIYANDVDNFNNSGYISIRGTKAAIYVDNVNSFTNTGTIKNTGATLSYGIYARGKDATTSTFINGNLNNKAAGTISNTAALFGIRAVSFLSFENYANISDTTAMSHGIFASNIKKLTNTGDINISAKDTLTAAIRTDGTVAEIINSGQLETSSGNNRMQYGIYIDNTGTIDSTTVTNSGKIYTSDRGIYVKKSANTFNITNTAAIGSYGNAIDVSADDITITNSGALAASGITDGFIGIGITATGRTIDITNNGTISEGTKYGISAKADDSASITNSGRLGTSAENNELRIGINGYGDKYSTTKIVNKYNSTIYVNMPGSGVAPAIGILAGAKYNGLGNDPKIEIFGNLNYVNNAGSITATAKTGGNAYGIYVQKGGTDTDEQSHSVINSGTINVTNNSTAGNLYGIYINSGTVKNSGTIMISGGADSYGIYQENGSTITNASGSSISGATYGIYQKTGSTITNAGSISNATYGIYQKTGSTITNAGSISNATYGIYQENGSTVLNTGSISNATYGIYADASNYTISSHINNININIKNNGKISATKYGMKVNIDDKTVLGLNPNLTFENAKDGTIEVKGLKQENEEDTLGAIGMYVNLVDIDNKTTTNSNSGKISVTQYSGNNKVSYISAVGVYIDGAYKNTFSTNIKVINFTNEKTGEITVTGKSAAAIDAYTIGTITNNGTIKVYDGSAINIAGSNILLLPRTETKTEYAKINNTGKIYLNGTNGIYSQNYIAGRNSGTGIINIVKGTGLTKINNSGTINIASSFADFENATNSTGVGSIGILDADNLENGIITIDESITNTDLFVPNVNTNSQSYNLTNSIAEGAGIGGISDRPIDDRSETIKAPIAMLASNRDLENKGKIYINGTGAIGTWVNTDDRTITNSGNIIINGKSSVGMLSGTRYMQYETQQVSNGDVAGETSTAPSKISKNSGSIFAQGERTAGMFAFSNSAITNDSTGQIVVSGANSFGMYATGTNSSAVNNGTIYVTGTDSYGMFADNGATATNYGTIYVTGAGSYGMRARNGSTVVNNGTISVYGNGAGAIWANNSTVEINNSEDSSQNKSNLYIEKTATDSGQSVGIKIENGSSLSLNGSSIFINDSRTSDSTSGILSQGSNNTISLTSEAYMYIQGQGNTGIKSENGYLTINSNNNAKYKIFLEADNNISDGNLNKGNIDPKITNLALRPFPQGTAPTAPTPPTENELDLASEDEDDVENSSFVAEISPQNSSSGGSLLEDSIIIDENSTFVNNGTLLTNEDINFDNLTKAKGSSFQVTSSSIIAGNSFSGNVVANAEIVTTNENLREYSTENSFLGEDNGLTVTSGSYMFNANTFSSPSSSGSIGIVMAMRDFNDIMEDKKLGDYLSSNYDNGNRVAMFNRMKVATHKAQYDKIVNDELGLDFVPSLAKQNMDFNRDFTAQLNDEIFENLKNSRKDFITGIQYYHHRNSSYDGLEGYKSNGSNLYSLYNEDVSNTVNYGLGMSIGTNTSKFDDDSSTYQAMAQVYVPVALSSGDTTFVTMPQFGAGYGRYKRKVEGDKTHRANISSYTYGVSNQLRRGFEFEGLTIEPVAEINVLGLYSGKIKEKDNMFVKSQNAVSIEGGLGLYLGKSIEYANSSTLRLRFGGTYYREMNNPYQRISAGFADADGYYNMHGYNNSHDRGVISLKADYGWRHFNFYVKAAEYIEKNSNFSLQGGMNYKF